PFFRRSMTSPDSTLSNPSLSVVIPTFNNEAVLRRCLESWRAFGSSEGIEFIVIEDGCRDGTARFLEAEAATPWGQRHLRWIHMNDAHELRCTNAGMQAAKAPLVMAWQDDMFVTAGWLATEIIRTFRVHADIGLMSLSRGLEHHPLE